MGVVRQGKGRPNKTKPVAPQSSTNCKHGQQMCTRCGRSPPHNRAVCPARDQTCDKCGKPGHFKAVCRTKTEVGGVAATSQESTSEQKGSSFLGAISDRDTMDDPWAVELTLQGTPVTLHIDTGAEVTVISQKTWGSVGRPELSSTDRTLRGPDSRAIPTLGKFLGTFTHGTRQAEGDVYVVKKLTKSLLRRPAIRNLDLVKIVAAVDRSLKAQYPSLFQGLRRIDGDYRIELREDAQPFALSTPRRVAIPLLKSVELELNRMVKSGVITKVNQPNEWCSSMVVCLKPMAKSASALTCRNSTKA